MHGPLPERASEEPVSRGRAERREGPDFPIGVRRSRTRIRRDALYIIIIFTFININIY